ncbi:hypothetical protein BUALT_Bualt06G0075100 [Buddleja alternifolia]|uniref:Uncharacterized protein n=1 Tax=Buddleja alternifolia TaxID=168488 RepID=A0AAV6XF02_9LAMI|nr:hypothetical protein BUALT_Bualt06G0075100 [Buddleja alternifolia]
MESAISQVVKTKPHFFPSSPKVHFPSVIISLPSQNKQIFKKDRILRSGVVSKLKCGKEGGSSVSSSKLEKKLMENEELSIEIEELIGMKKLNENCKGIGGIVEVLECLEREAIMGEDEGRDPNDYNRRAMIFDRSSRVFQALKQANSDD